MIFTLAMILKELGEFHPICNQREQQNREIQGIFRYSAGQKEFYPNSIYICSAAEPDAWGGQAETVTFFVVEADAADICRVKNYCYCFDKDVTETDLLNCYMRMQAEYSSWDKRVHLDIINGCSLETMLDYASEIIEYPIQVYDSGFRILDTSKHHKKKLSDFEAASALGYTPPDFIRKIQERNIMPRLQEAGHVIAAPGIENPGHTNLYRTHKIDGQVSGYSCVFCGEDRISQGDLDQVELVMQNLDFYFKENQKHMVLSKYMYESFLISLLSARVPMDSQIISDRAKIMHLPLRGEFVLVQLNFDGKDHFLAYLRRLIQRYLPEHSAFVYEGYIYLLIAGKLSEKSSSRHAAEIMEYLQNMLPSYHFSCCISNTFFELSAIYDAYQICKRLESMREQFHFGEGTYAYQDWQTILHCLQYGGDFDLKALFLPEVCKIRRYDAVYHTHYLATLSAYFANNCNLRQTAEALSLHRNSAANRIEKIRQLFGLDLSDFKTCCSAYETLQLMELIRTAEEERQVKLS